jgi:4,5-DOPA dioxygenase extradiol
MSPSPLDATAAADRRIAANHPFAQHLRRVAASQAAEPQRSWTPGDGALPSLYISHGAPPLFEDSPWMAQLHDWARAIPRPKAIVIVSAHWEAAPTAISSTAAGTRLVYDFGGFHPMYYEMQYATPDASDLGRRVRQVLDGTEPVHEVGRGLDHGAWVPLKVMYPQADIPVVQLSLPTHDPGRLLAIGSRLRELRHEGVLVVGSGFMTHGLPFISFSEPDRVPAWSADFDAWAAAALGAGDLDELTHYSQRAPGLRYAHPTVEHFTPIFVALGASSDPEAPVTTTIDGYMIGLSKRSFQAA